MAKKAVEHHEKAAHHADRAAHLHREAASRHKAGNHDAAAEAGHKASGHGLQAMGQAEKALNAYVEHVHLLMRESRHRAKNTLSLVQAIARQTAKGHPDDFLRSFTDRIIALAANQDLMGRSSYRGVDLNDLVCAQLSHFTDLIGSRITLGGPKLRLNTCAAETIGVALNELATNSAKYGALSTEAGRVNVNWRFDGEGELEMKWSERDGPPVSPPKREGFGSIVITALAKLTVGGEVDVDYLPSGITWRMACPARNVLQPEQTAAMPAEAHPVAKDDPSYSDEPR
jgi:two-component sensor histidine kinase